MFSNLISTMYVRTSLLKCIYFLFIYSQMYNIWYRMSTMSVPLFPNLYNVFTFVPPIFIMNKPLFPTICYFVPKCLQYLYFMPFSLQCLYLYSLISYNVSTSVPSSLQCLYFCSPISAMSASLFPYLYNVGTSVPKSLQRLASVH